MRSLRLKLYMDFSDFFYGVGFTDWQWDRGRQEFLRGEYGDRMGFLDFHFGLWLEEIL